MTEGAYFTCCVWFTETERHERERKGDLDKFERVDGDRNLTSVDLAVKKVRVMQQGICYLRCLHIISHTHLIIKFLCELVYFKHEIIPEPSILLGAS